MSRRPGRHDESVSDESGSPAKGPNLIVLYALLVLGILGAMAVAAMIVWPFYGRR